MNKANKWLIGLTGAALISGVVSFEGDYNKHLSPYKDIKGIPTVCSGHTGVDVKMGQAWSPAACKAVLEHDLVGTSKGILQCVNVPLTENQYNAFTLFAYNVGVNAFCTSSTVLKPLNAGRYETACNGMSKWVYADGKYSEGLNNRRKIEVAMCLSQSQN